MITFDVVEAQRPGQRVEHLAGDGGLAALFDPAVVVRAQPGQHGEFLAPQPRHPAGPRERLDAGLGGGQPIPPGAQELPQRDTVPSHPLTIGADRCARVVLP